MPVTSVALPATPTARLIGAQLSVDCHQARLSSPGLRIASHAQRGRSVVSVALPATPTERLIGTQIGTDCCYNLENLFPILSVSRTHAIADDTYSDIDAGSLGSFVTAFAFDDGTEPDPDVAASWYETRVFLTYDLPAGTTEVRIAPAGWASPGAFFEEVDHGVEIKAGAIADAADPPWDGGASAVIWTDSRNGVDSLSETLVPAFVVSAAPGPFLITYRDTSSEAWGFHLTGPAVAVPVFDGSLGAGDKFTNGEIWSASILVGLRICP